MGEGPVASEGRVGVRDARGRGKKKMASPTFEEERFFVDGNNVQFKSDDTARRVGYVLLGERERQGGAASARSHTRTFAALPFQLDVGYLHGWVRARLEGALCSTLLAPAVE